MQSAIMVKLPETFGGKEAHKLGRELNNRTLDHSSLVLVDLSRVRRIDLEGIEGLLNCVEMVARNDGSLQLAEISPEAVTILELTRMDRLFQKFSASEMAANFTTEEELAIESESVTTDKIAQVQPVAA